jgi:hypothetical protein
MYGNQRTSTVSALNETGQQSRLADGAVQRINPSLLHWREVERKDPTPNTPTYEEAMKQVQQTVLGGYRPPSYLSVNGEPQDHGDSPRRRDGLDSVALGDVHPLERERMRAMAQLALEGRNQI